MLVRLQCAGCGANLEIKPDTMNFACGYCGASQMVDRAGGAISLRLMTEAVARVQTGTDKTAAELAIRRLKEEISVVNDQYHSIHWEYQKALQGNTKTCFWIGGIIALALLCSVVNNYPLLGLLFVATVISGTVFLWQKFQKSIHEEYQPILKQKSGEYQRLNHQLAAQYEIVSR